MRSVPPASITTGFQEPRNVQSPDDCFFYHSIDLPGFGLQVGQWDLRKDIETYLGHVPLAGKRVVDVGAASGFVSFEMERRGAEVIAFDRDLTDRTDDMGLVPFADFATRFGRTLEQAVAERFEMNHRMQDSFWLAHRLFKSRVRLYCGNVYDGLVGVDHVDVSFFGCILLHLRDPLLALTRFAQMTRETVIITDTYEEVGALGKYPIMVLRPNVNDGSNPGTWWWPTPSLLQTFLQILGFRHFSVTRHHARHVQTSAEPALYTLVARR